MKDVIVQYIKNEYLEDDEDLEIDENTKLISNGIIDSFSMVSLKAFLEKKYDVHIPDEKASPEAFDTVKKIIELIKELKKK